MNRHRTDHSSTMGLEAWLESTRIVLPLRAVSIRAEVTAGLADVSIDQCFEQDNAQALDCRFLFPLPADAAAYRCEMHVNGRVILAKVEERAAARRHFKMLKASGRRVALAESERENLFTLQLGNLQPGDRILMRFAYLQPVQRLREQRTLRIPVNPGVRYIPGEPLLRENSGPGTADDTDQVPDASRITTPRIDGTHPDAATLQAVVRLRQAQDLADGASSPSHPLLMRWDGGDLVAALAAGGHLPDRDFIFTWLEQPPTTPVVRAWLDESRRGLLEIRLPAGRVALRSPSPAEPAASLPSAADLAGPPDVYVLLDRSGSMRGDNWTGACKALAAFVPRLHPDSRVWLTLFESGTRDYDAVPVRAGEIDFGAEGEKIRRHGTTGGTELVPALLHLGTKIRQHSTGRSAVVLLITDGEVGNEQAAAKVAAEFGCPVHLLGVAMTANDGLEAVARATGGRSVFLAPGEDLPAAVERFAPVLRAPVVKELTLPAGWQTAGESSLHDLGDGDDLVVPLSAAEGAPDLRVLGRMADGSAWSVVPEIQAHARAGLLWARPRIRHLDATGRSAEALGLAREFNLLSQEAAFLAWDEVERVPVAQTEIVQPAAEVALGGAFGFVLAARISPAGEIDGDVVRNYLRMPQRLDLFDAPAFAAEPPVSSTIFQEALDAVVALRKASSSGRGAEVALRLAVCELPDLLSAIDRDAVHPAGVAQALEELDRTVQALDLSSIQGLTGVLKNVLRQVEVLLEALVKSGLEEPGQSKPEPGPGSEFYPLARHLVALAGSRVRRKKTPAVRRRA